MPHLPVDKLTDAERHLVRPYHVCAPGSRVRWCSRGRKEDFFEHDQLQVIGGHVPRPSGVLASTEWQHQAMRERGRRGVGGGRGGAMEARETATRQWGLSGNFRLSGRPLPTRFGNFWSLALVWHKR
jgi:hypothetical protein